MIKENAPVNSVGGGSIAAVGIGPNGEPGVKCKKPMKRKTFLEFIETPSAANVKNSKVGVVNQIVSNFQRFVNSGNENDNAALIMLTAALSAVSVSDSPQSLQMARRLAQMALQRASKRK